MSEKPSQKIPAAIYLVIVWAAINALFMVLELTVFGDSADLNNSIELILWIATVAGLVTMRKWGAAIATFTFSYTLSTSMGNVIYYSLWEINGPRVLLNAVIIIYLYRAISANKFK